MRASLARPGGHTRMVLGERLAWPHGVGGGLIVAGTLVLTRA